MPMQDIAVISLSSRSLVESATANAYQLHSLDCFADTDTQEKTVSFYKLNYHDSGFDENELLDTVRQLVFEYPDILLVVGSGFESQPEQLNKLAQLAPVIANRVDTIRMLKDPKQLQAILGDNEIKHPEILFSLNECDDNYLLKQVGAEGGGHVKWLGKTSQKEASNYYYQEYVTGDVMSAVVLSNGTEARIVGFNYQLRLEKSDDHPFQYRGAISTNDIDNAVFGEIQRIVTVFTQETDLRGLYGLDFIKTKLGEIFLLEINPRPPASFELHEQTPSLFEQHLTCFQNKPIESDFDNIKIHKGYAILYMKRDITIHANTVWPAWVKDRPDYNESIKAGAPVCSVFAREDSVDLVKTTLFDQLDQIESQILTLQNAA